APAPSSGSATAPPTTAANCTTPTTTSTTTSCPPPPPTSPPSQATPWDSPPDCCRKPITPHVSFPGSNTKDNAMDVIPQGFLDILTEKKALAHLATVQPDGSP